MILSPLSKVVLEAWGNCVLGYALLPNCCAENGLHPCIIFQVGKPNTPQSSFSGVATIPKQAWQIDFCVHKSTTCYSQELAKSKKSLHALKALFCRFLSLSLSIPLRYLLFPIKHKTQSAWHGCEGTPESSPYISFCSIFIFNIFIIRILFIRFSEIPINKGFSRVEK